MLTTEQAPYWSLHAFPNCCALALTKFILRGYFSLSSLALIYIFQKFPRHKFGNAQKRLTHTQYKIYCIQASAALLFGTGSFWNDGIFLDNLKYSMLYLYLTIYNHLGMLYFVFLVPHLCSLKVLANTYQSWKYSPLSLIKWVEIPVRIMPHDRLEVYLLLMETNPLCGSMFHLYNVL